MFHTEYGFVVTDDEVTRGAIDPEELDTHLDAVLDALYTDPRIADPDYTATLAVGEVDFSLDVEADNPEEAWLVGLAAMRAAIHAADGSTPGWEIHFQRGTVSKQAKGVVDEGQGLIPT